MQTTELKERSGELLTFAEIICDKICDGHNQHEILMIEGKTGEGKSNAALYIAYCVSLLMAERLGGKPSDYFTVDNVAIITADEVLRVVRHIKKHGIYILDDIGAEGLSARKWQSDVNDVMTRVLQTFRTNENLLIMTVPDRDFVDKIGRNLLHHKIVMKGHWYDIGISLGKLSTVRRIYTKDGKGSIYPYIRHKGVIYNFALFRRAPPHIVDIYEQRRESIERETREKIIDELNSNIEISKEKEVAKRLKEAGVDETIKLFHGQVYLNYRNEGYSADEANAKANSDTGLNVGVRTSQKYAKSSNNAYAHTVKN